MKDQFVTYEIAKSLNEMRFNEPTFGLYKNLIFYHDHETFQWSNFDNCIKAPLWQQTIKWLAEKYNIIIEIKFNCFFVTDDNDKINGSRFEYVIHQGFIVNGKFKYKKIGSYNLGKYIEVCELAILKAIELIKST